MGRKWAASFSLDNKAYVGTGTNSSGQFLKDFWMFNPQTGAWTQKADVGSTPRTSAVAFAIGTKGYLGSGYINPIPNTVTNDFYEYNPATDVWTTKQSIGAYGRAQSNGFSIGGKGYVTLGVKSGSGGTVIDDTTLEYDPSTNTWSAKANFPGEKREGAGVFVLSGIAYVGGGYNLFDYWPWRYYGDLWAYNPSTNAWIKKASWTNLVNLPAVNEGFAVGNKGYLLTRAQPGTDHLVEYDPVTNSWMARSSPPTGVFYSAAFGISSIGYYATGGDYTKQVYRYLSNELRIVGSELVCSSNSAFTLNHVDLGSVSWTKSSNLTYVSGQGTATYTVAGNSIGNGWVRADVTTASGSTYYQIRNFWVGAYGSSNYPITGQGFACSYSYLTYFVTPLNGATNYSWSWPSDWTYVSGQGTNTLAVVSSANSGAVTVRVDNTCGAGGSPAVKFTQINSCGGFMMQVSPNPASDVLHISLVSNDQNKQETFVAMSDVEVTLVNSDTKLVREFSTRQCEFDFATADLPEGIYYVKVVHNGQVFRERIKVDRRDANTRN